MTNFCRRGEAGEECLGRKDGARRIVRRNQNRAIFAAPRNFLLHYGTLAAT
jgi:hypothetical protein